MSVLVAARRLLDSELISRDRFFAFYDQHSKICGKDLYPTNRMTATTGTPRGGGSALRSAPPSCERKHPDSSRTVKPAI